MLEEELGEREEEEGEEEGGDVMRAAVEGEEGGEVLE